MHEIFNDTWAVQKPPKQCETDAQKNRSSRDEESVLVQEKLKKKSGLDPDLGSRGYT